MNDRDRASLLQQLESMDGNERNKLLKRAAKLRKSEQRNGRGARRRGRNDFDDESGGRRSMKQRGGPSLEDCALRLLAEEQTQLDAAAALADDASDVSTTTGTVAWIGSGHCVVQVDDEPLECTLAGHLVQRQRTAVAVGDDVQVDPERAEVVTVLPRRTRLSRPDPADPHIERVIAANIDAVGIVLPLGPERPRTGIVDRFLVAVTRGGAEPFVVGTKLDLCAHGQARSEAVAAFDIYEPLGVRFFGVSSMTGEGVDELRAYLGRRLIAFSGHSGVGKSSLLNALDSSLELDTGEVREADNKGRHTTTASTLHRLSNGARVVDTPGIRQLGLWDVDMHTLASYFPDFAPFAASCRFGDCTHVHEPGCAVRAAAETGALRRERLEAYERLRDTL